jgi:pyruvate,orthophosphate dikinase
MRICIQKARSVKPDLEIGICGEHGGEPNSVWFCHEVGLNYVSCSAFRIPVARLLQPKQRLGRRGKPKRRLLPDGAARNSLKSETEP